MFHKTAFWLEISLVRVNEKVGVGYGCLDNHTCMQRRKELFTHISVYGNSTPNIEHINKQKSLPIHP